jgi:hypothetical protein
LVPPFANGKCTTDGVSRWPLASAMTKGMPESTVATSEFVVPKSMPTILLMCEVHFNHQVTKTPSFAFSLCLGALVVNFTS